MQDKTTLNLFIFVVAYSGQFEFLNFLDKV